MTLACRLAGPADVPVVAPMLAAMQEHYREEVRSPAEIEARLTRWLVADGRMGRLVICVDQDQALGFATYSVLVPGPDLRTAMLVKDLFVLPAARGRGAGQALMRHLAAICLAEGIARIDLTTESWNEGAVRFYRRIGGDLMHQKRYFRFAGEAFAGLAQARPK